MLYRARSHVGTREADRVQLNQDQQTLLIRIQENPGTRTSFEVLCAEFEAALYKSADPEDLETTGPIGVAVIHAADEKIDVADASLLIAVAWLQMVAAAIMEQDGDVSADIFDEDGVSAFCDSRPLFDVARACGFGSVQARRAIARVRAGAEKAEGVPSRALKILRGTGAIRRPRPTSRIVALKPCFAAQLDHNEIARAKAGSLYYSLVAQKDGYTAVRCRKTRPRHMEDATGAPIDVIGEPNVDVMDGFDVPLVPCEELHRTALDHFIQFLDEANDRKSTNTYQRLVHRALAA